MFKGIFSASGNKLLIAQIIAHLALIPMILYATWWQWLIALVVYFLNGCLGMSMTHHRLLSHRSWKCPTWLEYTFTLFATIGMIGSAIGWVSAHRRHHRFLNTERDPLCPAHQGYFRVQWLGMLIPPAPKYALDLARKPFYRWEQDNYFLIILAYATLLYLISPFAVIYAFLVPAAMIWTGSGLVNSVSHRYGVLHDDFIISLLVWGEGPHAVHHTNESLARFGKFDISGKLAQLIDKTQR